jgi:cell division control protein 6
LEAIANLQTSGAVPARSKEIQRTYEQVADSHAATPLSTLKSIQDHLSDLHMLGFLNRHEQNKGLSGGQYYEYELDLDPEIVLETRTEITEHTG